MTAEQKKAERQADPVNLVKILLGMLGSALAAAAVVLGLVFDAGIASAEWKRIPANVQANTDSLRAHSSAFTDSLRAHSSAIRALDAKVEDYQDGVVSRLDSIIRVQVVQVCLADALADGTNPQRCVR